MILKENIPQSLYKDALAFFKNKKVIVAIVVLFIYSSGLILFSGVLYKEGFFGEVLKPLLVENIHIPVNYVKGVLSEPEHITIDIKHRDFQKLAYKRKVALELGVLHPYKDDFVAAKIRWKGKTIKVKMRLKGDLGDHWARDFKWSFRVKTKGDKTIMGMRNFSLQHPRTRGFLNDWHLHKMLERLGFITLRYDFVDVTVNGKHLGVYAIEEHFEKALLENNKRINGPIVRIKDHLLWYRIEPDGVFTADTIDELYTSSPIDAFTTGEINADAGLLSNFNKAKNLLELFRRGELLTHQVFDVDKLAKLFAVIDLFGYRHTTAYSNIRFYYNPITSLLVPIGYDNTFIQMADSIEGQAKELKLEDGFRQNRLDWKRTFFEDRVFFEKYVSALEEVSERRFLEGFFEEIKDEYDDRMAVLYRSFPGYSFEEQRQLLYFNQEFIKKILNPLEGIQAYVKELDYKNNILTLELGNIQLLPVEILNISYGDNIYQPINVSNILQTKKPFEVMEFKKFNFEIPGKVMEEEDFKNRLKVNYKIFGTSEIKSISVFPWTYLDEDFIRTDIIRQKTNYEKFDFIEVNKIDKVISVKPGSWELNENIIIPEGFLFICNKGVEIDLTNSAVILSYSPILFDGEEAKPIFIKSSDSTGQGIVIVKSKKKSIIKNTVFDNLSSPSQGGWTLNAGVTFYESDVEIYNSQFTNARSASALDIIRSKYSIAKARFTDASLDALRIIFSKGSITKSIFSKIEKDGIYISGGVLDANDIYIDNASSTAISANDGSRVNIENIEVSNSKTASVSKDSSDIKFNNMTITNVDNGFVVFNQKSEFGPATVNADSVESKNVKTSYLVEEGSSLSINKEIHNKYHHDFSRFE